MENEKSNISLLFERAAEYVETKIELFKLQTVGKLSEIISTALTSLFILVFILSFIFMLNIGLALWIGHLLGKPYYGFFIVAGFYLLIAVILYLARHRLIKEPISNLIIKKILN